MVNKIRCWQPVSCTTWASGWSGISSPLKTHFQGKNNGIYFTTPADYTGYNTLFWTVIYINSHLIYKTRCSDASTFTRFVHWFVLGRFWWPLLWMNWITHSPDSLSYLSLIWCRTWPSFWSLYPCSQWRLFVQCRSDSFTSKVAVQWKGHICCIQPMKCCFAACTWMPLVIVS